MRLEIMCPNNFLTCLPTGRQLKSKCMKTIFTLTLGFLTSLAAMAGFKPSQLTVKVQDRGNYRIVVDGKRFESFGSGVIITNVDPGYHTVAVSKTKAGSLFGILDMRYETLV